MKGYASEMLDNSRLLESCPELALFLPEKRVKQEQDSSDAEK